MNTLPLILHVDDDPNDLLLFRHACRSANLPFALESVGEGELAMAYLSGLNPYAERQRYPLPDLLLLDLKMPRRTGFEIIEWVRSQAILKRLPVVVLTSSRHEADIHRAYEQGANSYLVKPVGFDALVEVVKEIHHYWLNVNERPTL